MAGETIDSDDEDDRSGCCVWCCRLFTCCCCWLDGLREKDLRPPGLFRTAVRIWWLQFACTLVIIVIGCLIPVANNLYFQISLGCVNAVAGAILKASTSFESIGESLLKLRKVRQAALPAPDEREGEALSQADSLRQKVVQTRIRPTQASASLSSSSRASEIKNEAGDDQHSLVPHGRSSTSPSTRPLKGRK